MFIVLNCLSLGIYGFMTSIKIGKEINALCKGDGEAPRFGYVGAVMIRGISTFIGLVIGLIMGIVGINQLFGWFGLNMSFLPGSGGLKAITIFTSLIMYGYLCTFIGSIISGIYLNYWWQKQNSRLRLNAWRFNMAVNETGSDTAVFRTFAEILFVPITVLLYAFTLLIPVGIAWLITLANSIGATVAALVIIAVCSIPVMLFGSELSTGACFSLHFTFKNINRFANVYRNGAKPFDPMGYEYYPSISNHYIRSLPGFVEEKI